MPKSQGMEKEKLEQLLEIRSRKVARYLSLFSISIGTLCLFGWAFTIPELKRISPLWVTMKPNTAAGLVLLGISILFSMQSSRWKNASKISFGAGLFVMLLGFLTDIEHLFAVNFGIDAILFHDSVLADDSINFGRPSPITASVLALLGLSAILPRWNFRRAGNYADALCGACIFLLVPSVIGYLFGVSSLYSIKQFAQVAFHTAVALMALAIAMPLSRPSVGTFSVFISESAAGVFIRKMLPVLVLFPVTLGWVRLWAQDQGFIDTRLGLAIMLLGNICVPTLVLWIAARRLESTLAKQRLSEQQLRQFVAESSHPVSMVDREMRYILASNAWISEFKLPCTDLVGKSHYELFPNVDDERKLIHLRCLAGATEKGEDAKYLQKDGTFLYYKWEIRPWRDETGAIGGLLLSGEDITARKKTAETISRMAAIAESSADAVIGMDIDGLIRNWNRAASEIFGYSLAETVGQPVTLLVPEDKISETASILEKVRLGQRVENLEAERLRKDGSLVWISMTISPIKDETGKVIGISGVLRDITKARAAEAKLRENDSRFKKIFESEMFGMFYWNTAGEIFSANDEFLRLTKYTREDLETGKINWSKMTPEEYQHLDQNALKEFEKEGRCRPYEKEYFCKDGTRLPIIVGGTLLSDLPGVGGIGFVIDNSAAKVAQSALREALQLDNARLEREVCDRTNLITHQKHLSEQLSFRLNFAAGAAKIGIWEWNLEINSLIWDDRMYQLYGIKDISAHEPYTSWENGLHPEDKERAVSEIRKAIEDNTKFDTEFRVIHPSGEVRTIHAIAATITGESGEVVKMIGINADVTKEKLDQAELMKAREEAISASKLKSEFLANMSHEIRTPINGVIGMTGLLLDTELKPEQIEYAENIRNCADSLLTVINDILDFSKVEAGKLDLEYVDFDLDQLIHDSYKALAYTARQKGLTFSVERTGWPVAYHGDPGRIRQIITNLLNNAIKFTSAGTVAIRLLPLENEKDFTKFRFEIRDSGIGIPKEAMSRMFQSFSQADSSMTRRFGGTGLGLSICKKLVELMGGVIGVVSEEGKGSTFWFELALKKGPAINTHKELEAEQFQPRHRSTKPARILIAEDNPINQKIAIKQLQKLGYYADAVGNGNEAIDALISAPYDLVLMDCQMPGMDGYVASTTIRKLETMKFCNIPIVAMTANAVKGDKERCLEAGMSDYVSKPVKIEELKLVLEKWLQMAAVNHSSQEDEKSEGPAIVDAIFEGLKELDGGELSFAKELGVMFTTSALKQIPKMRGALGKGDFGEIQKIAHQMKSSSGNLGAMRFSHLCDRLETLEDWSNASQPARLINELEAELQRVNTALEARLGKAS